MRGFTRANRGRSWLRIVVALGLVVIVMVPVAVTAAGGRFIDDDQSVFEADIEWMAANGITVGCNPPGYDRYCPEDAVNRGQMAAFMHRLAVNKVVDAATAVTADSAATADSAKDAETLDGHAPGDFAASNHTHPAPAPTNDGYSVYYDGQLNVVGQDMWGTSMELTDLPAGNYFVIASGTFRTAEIMTVAHPQCQLVVDGTASDFLRARLEPNGSTETFALTSVGTIDSDGGAVQFDCRDWGEMVSIEDPRMTAIQLGNLINTEMTGP